MRPDRQRRGARHGRGRKAGNAPERIPAPIQRAAARFLYLARPGAGFSPFPGFPRRVGKGHPSHRQKSASKPPNVWGVAALALRCRERSGAGSLSAEIQLGFTCAIPTPPLFFTSRVRASVPRSAALRASLVADQLQRPPIGVHVLQISGASLVAGQLSWPPIGAHVCRSPELCPAAAAYAPSRESLQRFFVVPSPRCPPLQKDPPISPLGVCPSLPY